MCLAVQWVVYWNIHAMLTGKIYTHNHANCKILVLRTSLYLHVAIVLCNYTIISWSFGICTRPRFTVIQMFRWLYSHGCTKHSDCINKVWWQVLTWQWWWNVLKTIKYTNGNDPMHTSVEAGYLLYLQNQCIVRKKGKQGDKWIHAHQSRSAAYTSGGVPRSLFKTAWLCWMYQLSNMQHVVVCWWWSSTSDWLRSTACPVLNTCSAKADVWTSPFFSARRCSLIRCLRLLPVWPMYTLEHSTQGMEYTTPLRSSTGTGSFGRTSIWWRVRRGQNTTLTPKGGRTRLIASDSPLM